MASEQARQEEFPWRWTILAVVGLGALFWAERRYPLRPRAEPEGGHVARNLTLAALNAAVLHVVETPSINGLTRLVARYDLGLSRRPWVPVWARLPVALLLMDYTFYLWHRACHRFPGLWRLHAVHHADRDLDASTAIRFHIGETLASLPVRAAQIVLAGLGPRDYAIWKRAFVLSVAFHHANLRLPAVVDRILSMVLVTPRLHDTHHSQDPTERESNWASGLVLWDQLHGTLRRRQRTAAIGDPDYAKARERKLAALLRTPFLKSA